MLVPSLDVAARLALSRLLSSCAMRSIIDDRSLIARFFAHQIHNSPVLLDLWRSACRSTLTARLDCCVRSAELAPGGLAGLPRKLCGYSGDISGHLCLLSVDHSARAPECRDSSSSECRDLR